MDQAAYPRPTTGYFAYCTLRIPASRWLLAPALFLLALLAAHPSEGQNVSPAASPDPARSALLSSQAGRKSPSTEQSKRLLLARAREQQSIGFTPAAAGTKALYTAQSNGFRMSLNAAGLSIAKSQRGASEDPIGIQFKGASPDVSVEGLEPTAAYTNYFVGNDASKWREHVPSYNRVRYKDLYPGIDLIYYGETHRRLEYDLVVSPGADPNLIHLSISGNQHAVLDHEGNLLLDGAAGDPALQAPVVYQDIDNGKRIIHSSFVQLADNEFGFKLAAYDHSHPLIIDPTINLLYSTYIGGNDEDDGLDITVDAAGNSYLTGYSVSRNFPVSANGIQQTNIAANLGPNAIILKFDASGTLLFSTYLGGTAAAGDEGEGIRVDQNGRVYVTGFTTSSNFPVTANAFQPNLGGGKDVFFAALSGDGSQLLYSTYLGGAKDEDAYRMAMDASGNVWLTGSAAGSGLPVTAGVYQSKINGAANGFIAKLAFNSANAQPLQIEALTFLGGSSKATGLFSGLLIPEPFADGFEDIEFDAAGNVYVAGATTSSDFPATANAYQQPSSFALTGSDTCTASTPYSLPVIAELSSDLATLKYATALSGRTGTFGASYPFSWGTNCRQYANTVHPDANGNIWVAGYSTAQDFPTTSNRLLGYPGVMSSNITLTELTPGTQSTTLTYSTYLGSVNGSDAPRAVWDPSGNIFLSALAGGGDWPGVNAATTLSPLPTSITIPPVNPTITELSPTGTSILYATYLGGTKGSNYSGGQGGSRRSMPVLDAQNNLRLTGSTMFIDYPVTANAFESIYADGFQSSNSNDVVYSVIGTGTIGTISTTVGGDAGDSTVTISGAGFLTGAYCTLFSGGTTIQSTTSKINAAGTSITCTFALKGVTTGTYDISVVNPNGGGSFTQQGGFTVQAANGPNVWVNIVGRSLVRFNTPSTYTITYGNTGDTDAIVVPIYITVPDGITVSLVTPLAQVPVQSNFNANTLPTTYEMNGMQVIPLDISRIPAGGSGFVQIQLTVPSTITSFEITASHSGPWASSLADLQQAVPVLTPAPSGLGGQSILLPDTLHANAYAGPGAAAANAALSCTADLVNLGFSVVSLAAGPAGNAANCAVSTAGLVGGIIGVVANPPDGTDDGLISAGQLEAGLAQAAVNCAAAAAGATPPGLAVTTALNAIQLALALAQTAKDCSDAQKPKDPQGKGGKAGTSDDPNYKAGPVGDASASQYMAPGKAFTYSLGFENEATATLPAAKVVITDQLDPTKVDLSTLSLGPITIGATTITPPTATNDYNTTYKLSSTLNILIQGSLDTSTGLLKWTFTSIDPSTGQPPTDPTIGFLPPDTDGIVGQGSVLFNVMPKSGQTTGTQIKNTASVVFDSNAAILTPTWLNTLDVDLPTSSMIAIPSTIAASAQTIAFPISWSGKDVGSGVVSYSIYTSDNGGPFTHYNTYPASTTMDSFIGTAGHTYGFYSIATDGAGNLQAAKTNPDTSTTISSNLQSTSTTLTATPNPSTLGQSVALSATIISSSGSTAAPTGTVTFLDGATVLGTAPLSAGAATFSTASLAVGTHSLTASYGGDTTNAASTSNAVSEVIHSNVVATSSTLSVTPNPAVAGQAVQFTAQVTPATGTGVPTGTVTFLDGTSTLGTAALSSGVATFSLSTLAIGAHNITASYAGDSSNAASLSSTSTVTITAAPSPSFNVSLSPASGVVSSAGSTSTTLSVVPSAGFNQPVTFSCSGLPTYSTCTFSPSTVTPAGATATTSLSIQTGVAQSISQMDTPLKSSGMGRGLTMSSAAALLGLGLFRLRRRRTWAILSVTLLAGLACTAITGCGGTNAAYRTPSGTTTVTVSATSGTVTQTVNFTLTVQ